MRVEVKLLFNLGRLRSPGDDTGWVEVEDGLTVGRLKEILGLPSDLKCVVLINGRPNDDGSVLAEGDVVTMFPPVEGG